MGAAEKRLERAVARLETALATREPALPSASLPSSNLPSSNLPSSNTSAVTSIAEAEGSIAKSEGDEMREEIRNVTVRLDSAIHRLQRTLGE